MGVGNTKPSAVLISYSPMTLGIQFILGHLYSQKLAESYNLYGILAGNQDSTKIEAPFTEKEKERLIQWLKELNPVVIGISSIERTRQRSLGVLPELLRHVPEAVYVAGGIDAISNPDYYFSGGIDLVARGDGEIPTQELLKMLISNKTKTQIMERPPDGLINPSGIIVPAVTPDTLPLPYYGSNLMFLTESGVLSYDEFRNPAHVQFLNRGSSIDLYTQRGCTHECTFCAQDLLPVYSGNSYRNSRRRSLEDVVEHIISVKKAYPQKNFVYFWDLDFLRRPNEELLTFAQSYREKVGLPYFIFVTEKTVNRAGADVLKALVDAGLATINMGIQSGSERVLHQEYGRFNTPQEALRAIKNIHEATRRSKVEVLYDVITYNPNETPEEILSSIELVTDIPPGDGRNVVRLSTHALSFNSGQALYREQKPTAGDYQDFLTRPEIFERTQSPWLSFLLGHLMRGEITHSRIGSVRREKLPELVRQDFVDLMSKNYLQLQAFYISFVPRDNEAFLGG